MQIQLINLDRSPERLAEFKSVNAHLTDVERFAAIDGAAVDTARLVRDGCISEDILARDPAVPPQIPAHYTKGAIGVALSHLALWEKSIETARPLTICEDDAIFHSLYHPAAERIHTQLPPDWDIILWGWNANSPILFEALPNTGWCLAYFNDFDIGKRAPAYQSEQIWPMPYRLREAIGLVCYSVSPKGARALRDFCLPLRRMSVRSIGLKGVLPNSGIDVMMLTAYAQLQAFISFPPLVLTKNALAKSTVQRREPRSTASGDNGLEQVGAGKNELMTVDALCSEQFDRPDDLGVCARYAVFSAQRTGSGWLDDFLRQRGLGIPFEYFNHAHMPRIAARLGCMLASQSVDLERYIALLEPLRAKHGVFGTKLQPDQLRTISAGSDAKAVSLLRRFDQVLWLRRRDTLLQAISLVRAHLTNQWHLYGDDRAVGIAAGDELLFPMIGERLAKIDEDNQYMAGLVGNLDPKAVRMLWYEDLLAPGALDAIANELWEALRGAAPRPVHVREIAVARKLDETEAQAVKQRYLRFIGTV